MREHERQVSKAPGTSSYQISQGWAKLSEPGTFFHQALVSCHMHMHLHSVYSLVCNQNTLQAQVKLCQRTKANTLERQDIFSVSGYLLVCGLRWDFWLRPGPCAKMQLYWVTWVPWQSKPWIPLKCGTWTAPGLTQQSYPDNAVNLLTKQFPYERLVLPFLCKDPSNCLVSVILPYLRLGVYGCLPSTEYSPL